MIDFTKVIDKAIELGTISADKKEVLNDCSPIRGPGPLVTPSPRWTTKTNFRRSV